LVVVEIGDDRCVDSILDLIGNTRLVRLRRCVPANGAELWLKLARDEGIFAGISTGANVVGAHRLAERLGPEAVIVTLAVDSGFKYLSVSPFADLN
jgi:cysteine synthase